MTSVSGDILEARAAALVNPVNTVGVMGRGLAAQFKAAFPKMYLQYVLACREGRLRTGKVLLHECSRDGAPVLVVSFPTKQHWRNPSMLAWIVEGLADMRRQLVERAVPSVAIPRLGCGLGGLHWPLVRRAVELEMALSPSIDVLLYEC